MISLTLYPNGKVVPFNAHWCGDEGHNARTRLWVLPGTDHGDHNAAHDVAWWLEHGFSDGKPSLSLECVDGRLSVEGEIDFMEGFRDIWPDGVHLSEPWRGPIPIPASQWYRPFNTAYDMGFCYGRDCRERRAEQGGPV